jgi:hypothetical protein
MSTLDVDGSDGADTDGADTDGADMDGADMDKRVMAQFDGLAGMGNDDVCQYLLDCANDDERYEGFMDRLREYKACAGFSARGCKLAMSGFLFYLTAFCSDGGAAGDARQRARLARVFRTTFRDLERMRASSHRLRDFAGDFGCVLSVAGWCTATRLAEQEGPGACDAI